MSWLLALLLSVAVLLGAMTIVAYLTWIERKVSARFQNRVGPYFVGRPHGWLQPLADVAKRVHVLRHGSFGEASNVFELPSLHEPVQDLSSKNSEERALGLEIGSHDAVVVRDRRPADYPRDLRVVALATSSRATEREQEFRFVVLDRACDPGRGHVRHASQATSRDDEALRRRKNGSDGTRTRDLRRDRPAF